MTPKEKALQRAASKHAARALAASQWLADHPDYKLPDRIWANFRLAERTIYWSLWDADREREEAE